MDEETKGLIERLREHIPSMRRYKLEHAAHYAEQAAAALQAQADRVKALEEALKPSGDTKAAYMGEFIFTIMQAQEDDDGNPIECPVKTYVPWTTIKEIMQAISTRAIARSLMENTNA